MYLSGKSSPSRRNTSQSLAANISLRTKEVTSVAEEEGSKGAAKWDPGDDWQDRPRTSQNSDTTNCSNSPKDRGEVRAGKPLQRLKWNQQRW